MRIKLLSTLPLIMGCAVEPYVQAVPLPDRASTAVRAPFDHTWDAVIDVFASGNLPIAPIDNVSGLIVAAPLQVARQDAWLWTSCGWRHAYETAGRYRAFATKGEFNVLVRAAGQGATVRVTAAWSGPDLPTRPVQACTSTGVFESLLEARIKVAAER